MKLETSTNETKAVVKSLLTPRRTRYTLGYIESHGPWLIDSSSLNKLFTLNVSFKRLGHLFKRVLFRDDYKQKGNNSIC